MLGGQSLPCELGSGAGALKLVGGCSCSDHSELSTSGSTELHNPHCVTKEHLHFWLRQATKSLRGKARHTNTPTEPWIYFDLSSVTSSTAFVLEDGFNFGVSHMGASGTIPWALSPSQVTKGSPDGCGHLT